MATRVKFDPETNEASLISNQQENMKTNITFTIEKITPDKAKDMLERNHARQRNVVMGHVRFLADQMKTGQWATNGEPVIMDCKGNILDGQHRLHAVILSGVACDFAIVKGVNESAMDTINTGKSRTKGNIFAINGIENYNVISAACYLVWRYRRAIAANGSINMSTTKPSARDLMDIHDENHDSFRLGAKIAKRIGSSTGLPGSIVTAAVFLAIEAKHEQDKVEWFFDRLSDCVELPAKSPILALANYLKKDNASRAKLPNDVRFAMVVKAFNLYSSVKEARSIIVQAGEKFPELLK